MKSKNTVMMASAGSGKTYQLSNRFLEILFQSAACESLDTILASTFTCKAAGEISDNIFRKIADMVLKPEERQYIAAAIDYPLTENSEEDLQDRLVELAKNMYRMRVGTLDSHFIKMASAFSLELGFPPGWSVVDQRSEEFKKLLREAIREVLEYSDRDRITELMVQVNKGRLSKTMAADLAKLAEDHLSVFEDTKPETWKHDHSEKIKEIFDDLLDENEIEDELVQLESLDDGQIPTTGSGKNKKLIDAYCNARTDIPLLLRDGNWKDFFGKGLGKAVIPSLNDATVKCKFGQTFFQDKCPAMFPIVRTLALHARALLVKSVIERTEAMRELLEMISGKLNDVLHRERKFRFGDVTRRVAGFDFGNRLDSLNHRMNAETKHLLLDEFQDTSKPQWDILHPIAKRVADDRDGYFFCVGDLKQAIYSWRGGVSKIFETMKNTLEDEDTRIEPDTLLESYRSTQAVIDTVNATFEDIVKNPVVNDVSEDAGKDWQSRFEKHSVCRKMTGVPGYCTLEEFPDVKNKKTKEENDEESESEDTEEETPDDAFLDYVVKRIVELNEILKERSDLEKGIGVLVFLNKTVEKITTKLKSLGIEVNGKGKPLARSFAVRHILSALKLADHPGDTVSIFHLANGPLAEILKPWKSKESDETPPEKPSEKPKKKYFPADFASRAIRRDILSNGYGKTIKKYIGLLASSCDLEELQCLECLLELAYRFDETATGVRTAPFVERVKETSLSNPNAAKIQVMTVFGAKGLEFDIVVLPELKRKLEQYSANSYFHPSSQLIVGHETVGDATTQVVSVLRRPGGDVLEMLPEEYRKMYDSHIQIEVEDSLSRLYVAMTRAIRQLVMIVPENDDTKKKSDSAPKTLAEILRSVLPSKSGPIQAENTVFEHGDPLWYRNEVDIEEKDTDTESDIPELNCNVKDGLTPHHVKRIAPSGLHDGPPNPKSNKKAAGTVKTEAKRSGRSKPIRSEDDALLWGDCMHLCFEHAVLWLDGGNDKESEPVCGDAELRDILDEKLQERTAGFSAKDILAEFEINGKRPQIIAALSRSRYAAPNVEVRRERRFAVWGDWKNKNGEIERQIMRGSIDRLVIQRDVSGKIIGLEIMDYKTDTTDDEARAEYYRGQLDAYREAASIVFEVDQAVIKTTLLFVTTGKVVEL